MKKIPSLFARNYEGDRLVRDELVPGAEWVAAGEGIATVKLDGTACMIRESILYRRFDAKNGKPPPSGFVAAQDPDPVTGHWPGWILVSSTAPGDRWHREAFYRLADPHNGTYELCGPHINRNPHGLEVDTLIEHGKTEIPGCPRTFKEIPGFLAGTAMEGIVWHHPDGRMVKIKAKDFGLPWPPR